MPKFVCLFTDRQTTIDLPSNALTFIPQRWNARNVGGPDTAEVAVQGPIESLPDALRLVGDRIKIINEFGTVVWWGFVYEAEISDGHATAIASLEHVANRIAVVYTETRADGSSERKTTDWIEDANSIAKFGQKEDRPSFEGTTEAAQEFAAQELTRRAWPVPVRRNEVKAVGGMLYCQGLWHKLAWQYYENLAGIEEFNADGPGEQNVGASRTATTISFAAPDDINDSANGLGGLQVGDTIVITGAANGANNGTFTVGSVSAGSIEVVQNTLVNEAAGASVTMSIGGSRVDRIAQSFTLTTDTEDWTVASISVKALRVGSPTGLLTMELCSDSSGSPGTVLETVSLAGSSLREEMAWTEFPFSNTTSLTFGTTYWVVVRKPTPTISAYYVVDLDEDAGYAGGQVKVHNGSSWSVRSPAADMQFRITGKEGTLGQVRAMIQQNDEFAEGAFGPGNIHVVDQSNIQTWQYRDGDSRALDEIEDLIAIGRSTGESLQVDILETRQVLITKQPSRGNAPFVHEHNGIVRTNAGAPIEPGVTIAGAWVNVTDALPKLDIFLLSTSLFVAESEYDAQANRLNFDTDGALSVWRAQGIRTG